MNALSMNGLPMNAQSINRLSNNVKHYAEQAMLSKILFTLVVIIGVVIFFRNKQARTPAKTPATTAAVVEESKSVSPRIVAYGLLGALVGVSILLFALNWRSENRIVTIRVISDGATAANYQARYKSINGRSFVTLDGARVTLGESDRIEMLESQ